MTTLSRLEAAKVIATRLRSGKNGLPAKYAAHAWQGNDASPPHVRVYVNDAENVHKSFGYVAITPEGTASFDRVTSRAGAIKRLVGKALHGVDVMSEDVSSAEVESSAKVLWEGIGENTYEPFRIVTNTEESSAVGHPVVMTRAENGDWVTVPDDNHDLTMDALWSAVCDLAKGGR